MSLSSNPCCILFLAKLLTCDFEGDMSGIVLLFSAVSASRPSNLPAADSFPAAFLTWKLTNSATIFSVSKSSVFVSSQSAASLISSTSCSKEASSPPSRSSILPILT
ncbi:hypothetical protein NC651_030072 [Populus alba x Populus x berolinensis]|nr:hypothetical protein NC651_030072 [Populus alba x Populus x berolinensis]